MQARFPLTATNSPGNDDIKLLAAGKADRYACNQYESVVMVPRAGHLVSPSIFFITVGLTMFQIAQDAPLATAECVLGVLNAKKEKWSNSSKL